MPDDIRNNLNFWSEEPVLIVAEIGKNFIQTKEHQSIDVYLANAKQLIQVAKNVGANAVKFQTHNLEDEQLKVNIVSPHFSGSDRYEWVKRNEEATPLEFWRELKRFCDEIGIIFFSTPMSRGAAIKLEQVGVPFWKVGSGDILDFVLLDFLISTVKPIILSSGMSTLKEVDKTVNFLKQKNAKIALLYCVSKYPVSPEQLNLGTIEFYQQRYNVPIGFSDHSIGYESVVAAVNMGAKIIEKHFSLSRDLWGADHKVSMTPQEFKMMVDEIRSGKAVDTNNFGRKAKILQKEEAIFRPIFRKSLMAGSDIKAGTKLTSNMIYAMRPQAYAGGLPSEEYYNVIGNVVAKDLKKYDPIAWESLVNVRKRKICFIITSAIHYSRSKLILEELNNRDDVELQIVVGASAILDKYGDTLNLIEEDGYHCNAKIIMTLEGGSPVAMAKTTGIGITEFATAFDNLKPDLVVVRGDRYEVLAAAIAAAYLNITVAHIEGGDVTGTIDESVRHAVTKLSHIHFATNEKSKERIIRMGEDPGYVFNVGAPELEMLAEDGGFVSNDLINHLGVGDIIDINKLYLIVMQHSVTTEMDQNEKNVTETIEAIKALGFPTIWFWPNVDAGTDDISGVLRRYRELHNLNKNVRFIKYLPVEEFIGLLRNAACLIGNSSSGIKEASFLGTPVVNIGTRQQGRMKADNVINVGYNRQEIKEAVEEQLIYGKYESSHIYYKEGVSKAISDILATIKLYNQKSFNDWFVNLNMYKNKKILGIITARGESKGILRKNIKFLAGKPLIAHTIETAKMSKYLTRCIVSSDDEEIIQISKEYGADVPFVRPAELAQDSSTSIEVVQHTINWLKENENQEFDYIMILQPTSPLRLAEDIDECIKKIIDTNADSVMSMKELDDFSFGKLKRIDNDVILPMSEEEGGQSAQRQVLSKIYKRNCAIYLTKTDLILQGDLFGKISRSYIMPKERSLDINNPIDFEMAEFWINKRNN